MSDFDVLRASGRYSVLRRTRPAGGPDVVAAGATWSLRAWWPRSPTWYASSSLPPLIPEKCVVTTTSSGPGSGSATATTRT